MTAQYWKSVVVGFENRLVIPGPILPQRDAVRGIVLWDENLLTEQKYGIVGLKRTHHLRDNCEFVTKKCLWLWKAMAQLR